MDRFEGEKEKKRLMRKWGVSLHTKKDTVTTTHAQ